MTVIDIKIIPWAIKVARHRYSVINSVFLPYCLLKASHIFTPDILAIAYASFVFSK